jgi:hypothetical protein
VIIGSDGDLRVSELAGDMNSDTLDRNQVTGQKDWGLWDGNMIMAPV